MNSQAEPHSMSRSMSIVHSSLPQRASRQHIQLHSARPRRKHRPRQRDVSLQHRRVRLAKRPVHPRRGVFAGHADGPRDVRGAPAVLPARVQQDALVATQRRSGGRAGLVVDHRRVRTAAHDGREAVAQTARQATTKRRGLRRHLELRRMLVDVRFDPRENRGEEGTSGGDDTWPPSRGETPRGDGGFRWGF